MHWCTNCGYSLESLQAICPRCSLGGDMDAESGWTVVARFASAAEAGYFCDELASRLQSEPRLHEQNVLDPCTHAWGTGYVLTVKNAEADRAVQALNELIALTTEEVEPVTARHSRFLIESERQAWDQSTAAMGINWIPIILTITAGTFVLWAARKPAALPAEPARLDNLWRSLSLHPEPWVQRGAHGRASRQLTFDTHAEQIVLREDRDGDGVFELEEVVLKRAVPSR